MSIASTFRVLTSLLLLFASLQAESQRAKWNRPMTPFQVIGPIYYVGLAGVSAFLITTPQGNILLDGGLPESAALIEKNIGKLGFKLSDIRFLINSHAHYDHCGGLAELKRLSHARLVASAADALTLDAGGRGGPADFPKFPAVHVDRIIADGDKLALGTVSLVAHVTPGHTKGCTTWSTTAVEGGKTYNVAFYCSTSVVDKLVGNAGYPNIVSDYKSTFVKLRSIPSDVFLAPHAEQFELEEKLRKRKSGGQNPFIKPNEMRSFIDESEAEFQRKLHDQLTAAKH